MASCKTQFFNGIKAKPHKFLCKLDIHENTINPHNIIFQMAMLIERNKSFSTDTYSYRGSLNLDSKYAGR